MFFINLPVGCLFFGRITNFFCFVWHRFLFFTRKENAFFDAWYAVLKPRPSGEVARLAVTERAAISVCSFAIYSLFPAKNSGCFSRSFQLKTCLSRYLSNHSDTQKTLFFARNRHCRTINAVLSVIVAEPAEKCRNCIIKHYSTVKLSVNCG